MIDSILLYLGKKERSWGGQNTTAQLIPACFIPLFPITLCQSFSSQEERAKMSM